MPMQLPRAQRKRRIERRPGPHASDTEWTGDASAGKPELTQPRCASLLHATPRARLSPPPPRLASSPPRVSTAIITGDEGRGGSCRDAFRDWFKVLKNHAMQADRNPCFFYAVPGYFDYRAENRPRHRESDQRADGTPSTYQYEDDVLCPEMPNHVEDYGSFAGAQRYLVPSAVENRQTDSLRMGCLAARVAAAPQPTATMLRGARQWQTSAATATNQPPEQCGMTHTQYVRSNASSLKMFQDGETLVGGQQDRDSLKRQTAYRSMSLGESSSAPHATSSILGEIPKPLRNTHLVGGQQDRDSLKRQTADCSMSLSESSTRSVLGEIPKPLRYTPQYNRADLAVLYKEAIFFVLQAYNEEVIHLSMRHDMLWTCSVGNHTLDNAFQLAHQICAQKNCKCPVILFLKVGKDSFFRGVAEMVSPIYHQKHWFESCEDLSGSFHVRWHIVKDVPTSVLFTKDEKEKLFEHVPYSMLWHVPYPKGTSMFHTFRDYPNHRPPHLSRSVKLEEPTKLRIPKYRMEKKAGSSCSPAMNSKRKEDSSKLEEPKASRTPEYRMEKKAGSGCSHALNSKGEEESSGRLGKEPQASRANDPVLLSTPKSRSQGSFTVGSLTVPVGLNEKKPQPGEKAASSRCSTAFNSKRGEDSSGCSSVSVPIGAMMINVNLLD
uniref:YTH domain-containing family protein n=1 Tax=Oryza glumipatula TaxID=40148 RepID=A0A0D9ZUJ4_9ORYZ